MICLETRSERLVITQSQTGTLDVSKNFLSQPRNASLVEPVTANPGSLSILSISCMFAASNLVLIYVLPIPEKGSVVTEPQRLVDLFPFLSWTPGGRECEASPRAVHTKRIDGTAGFVTGQAKGSAVPVGAAALTGVRSRPDEFLAVIGAIVRGDKDALSELYDSTVAKVHGLVRAIVYNAADAEEITCDVYTQAWQTATNFDPSRGAVLSCLLAIARNRALDCLRRRRGKLRVFEDCGSECQTEHEFAEHDTPERALSRGAEDRALTANPAFS